MVILEINVSLGKVQLFAKKVVSEHRMYVKIMSVADLGEGEFFLLKWEKI